MILQYKRSDKTNMNIKIAQREREKKMKLPETG